MMKFLHLSLMYLFSCTAFSQSIEELRRQQLTKAANYHREAVDFENGGAPEKAFEMYLESASIGRPGAIHDLALCYRDGLGVLKNQQEYLQMIQKAAKRGYLEAMLHLAVIGSDQEEQLYWLVKIAAKVHDRNSRSKEIIFNSRNDLYYTLEKFGLIPKHKPTSISIKLSRLVVREIRLNHLSKIALPEGAIFLGSNKVLVGQPNEEFQLPTHLILTYLERNDISKIDHIMELSLQKIVSETVVNARRDLYSLIESYIETGEFKNIQTVDIITKDGVVIKNIIFDHELWLATPGQEKAF